MGVGGVVEGGGIAGEGLGGPAHGGDEGGEGGGGGGGEGRHRRGGGGAAAGHGEHADKLHGSGIGDDDAAAGGVGEEAAGAAVDSGAVVAARGTGEHAVPRLLGPNRTRRFHLLRRKLCRDDRDLLLEK